MAHTCPSLAYIYAYQSTHNIIYLQISARDNIFHNSHNTLVLVVYRVSKKKSPLTKCDTIAPNLEICETRFRHIDPDDTKMVLIDREMHEL